MLGNKSLIKKDPKKNPKILFVTGKGGVGKSTVAALYALKAAQNGLRVLLVELGERSYFASVCRQPVRYQPSRMSCWQWPIDVAIFDGPSCLKEFVAYYLKVEKIVDLFFENNVMRALVRAAPALKELAVLGKVTSGNREIGPAMPYDLIVVDAFSTGHFQSLFKVPQGMSEVIRFGPMGEQSRSIHQVMLDPEITQIKIVCFAEELPVQEALELQAGLKKQNANLPTEIIVNRWLDQPSSPPEASVASDFVQYMNKVKERQQETAEKMAGLNWRRLPFSFATDASQRIQDLVKDFP